MHKRLASVKRETKETQINLSLNLDGKGEVEVATGIPFLDHMLDLLAKHALFDLHLQAKGDLEVDAHHTVEDVGICLGQAFRKCLGEKEGIRRFGYSILPMDEALSIVAVDISGRAHLVYEVELPQEVIGNFDVDLVHEFFHAFVNHAAITLHIRLLAGSNAHHMVEAIFKGLAKALEQAVTLNPRFEGVPSTKGQI